MSEPIRQPRRPAVPAVPAPEDVTQPPAAAHSRETASPQRYRSAEEATVAGVSAPAAGSKSAQFPQQLPAPFGRYRLLKLLGKGGMGAVYLAHDTQLDRSVALKVPHFDAKDGAHVLERFYREARAAATILHANICPLYDVGAIDGTPYLTMAYVEGKPLSDFARARPLTPRQSALLVRKLALALQEAHQRGVIHRDLKPANVMLDRRGEAMIMDFGLARRARQGDPRLTQQGAALGTPAYMPPEQVSGNLEAMGPACDIYSLGVILYELLTGRLPFQGDVMAMLSQVLMDEPPRPSTVRAGLDPDLESICLKAMAKKPADRFGTMAEMAAALTDHLRNTRTDTQAWGVGVRPMLPDPDLLPEPILLDTQAEGGRLSVAQMHSQRSAQKKAGRSRVALWLWLAGAAGAVLLGWFIYQAANSGTPPGTEEKRAEGRPPQKDRVPPSDDKDKLTPDKLLKEAQEKEEKEKEEKERKENEGKVSLKGVTRKVGDVKVSPVKLPAEALLPCMVWADKEGSAFLALEGKSGMLRRISFPDFKVLKEKDLERKFTWMALSAEGLVLSDSDSGKIVLVDPVTLTVKRKIAVPKLKRATSAPGQSWAVACDGQYLAKQELYVVDLKKGTVDLWKVPGVSSQRGGIGRDNPAMTPDGKHVFTHGGNDMLVFRYAFENGSLEFEAKGPRDMKAIMFTIQSYRPDNTAGLTFSPDSKWVCLVRPNQGAAKVYRVESFEKHCTLEHDDGKNRNIGDPPLAVGFDPKGGYIYTQNLGGDLMVCNTHGVSKGNYPFQAGARKAVLQFLVHPDGNRVVMLTSETVYFIEVPRKK